MSNVLVADERVVATAAHEETGTHYLRAFDSGSGRQVWAREAAGVIGTTFDQGRVFVIARRGLTAYSVATGERLWNRDLSSGGWPDELGVAADGRLHVVAGDHLETFDAADGSLLWRHRSSALDTGPPAVGGGRVFVSADCGATTALDAATGAAIWRSPPASYLCVQGEAGRMPALSGPEVYARSRGGPSWLFDAASGEVLEQSSGEFDYELEASGIGGPMPVHGFGLVFRRAHDTIIAERAGSGDLAWRYSDPSLIATEPILANGTLYAGSLSGHLRAIDARTGELVWSDDTGRRFAGSQGGGWRPETNAPAGLAAGDGLIVAPAGDRLVAYRGAPPPAAAIDTSLDSTRGDVTANPGASFAFGSSRAGAAFECRLDGAPWTPCTSVKRLSGLGVGEHVFEVRATASGDLDRTPAAHRWAVAAPPEREPRDAVAYRQNAARDGHSTASLSPPLSSRWTRADLGSQVSYPLIVGGRVFVTAGQIGDWRLYALDGQSGETLWSHRVDAQQPGQPDTPQAAYEDGRVYSVTANGKVRAFSADDGTEVWSAPVELPIRQAGPPVVRDGELYVEGRGGSGSLLVSLDASDGRIRWSTGVSNGGRAAPALDDRRVYIANELSDSEEVRAFSRATGALEWSRNLGYSAGGERGSTVGLLDGTVFGPRMTYNRWTGLPLRMADPWSVRTRRSPLAFTSGIGVFSAGFTPTRSIEARDLATGERLWAFRHGDMASDPVIVGGHAYAASPDGVLHGVDLRTGRGIARVDLGAPVPPTVSSESQEGLRVAPGAGDGLLVVPARGRLVALGEEPAVRVRIEDGPSGASARGEAEFSFAASPEGDGFVCSLDDGAWQRCDEGTRRYSGLADGEHSFRVRAVDAQGAPDGIAAEQRWTVDTQAPDVRAVPDMYDEPAPGLSGWNEANFWLSSSEPGTILECRLDDGPWARCTGYKEYDGLRDGPHTFEARGRDAAGNVDPTPASYTWRIDDTSPKATITSPEEGAHTGPNVRAAFESTEPGSTFECYRAIDGSFAPCETPRDYTGLADGRYELSVKAIDRAGNDDTQPAKRRWVVDTGPPETTLSEGPTGVSTDEHPVFRFASSEKDSIVETRLDGGPWVQRSSGAPIYNLQDGEHTFEVRARDAADRVDPTPASRTWTLDTTAPQTSISAAPADPTSARDATFSPQANEVADFECRLDGAQWGPCTTPVRYENLTPGAHVFETRARDRAGYADPTPATHRWTIDTTPPETTIGDGPSGTLASRSASLSFSSESGAAFQCRLDAGEWSSCSSPKRYEGLAEGEHTFAVRAIDRAANLDPSPATRTWTVETGAPDTEITGGPGALTTSREASFAFRSEPGALFECRLDGGNWGSCLSPHAYYNVPDGRHTFAVRAEDALGNGDDTPAERTWTVDTIAPETSIDDGPAGTVGATEAQLAFSSEVGASFDCRLKRPGGVFGDWDECESPLTLSGLSDGDYAFEARARDAAGNADATAAMRAWTVGDLQPPTARAPERSLRPGTVVAKDAVPLRLAWSGSDDRSSATALRYDLEQRADATSPWERVLTAGSTTAVSRSLPAGTHQFRVRASDEAGNVGAWAMAAPVRLGVHQESSRAIAYGGSWTGAARANAFGGAVRVSSAGSARASLSFRGRLVAVVMPTRAGLGNAEVCVDGGRCETVDLGVGARARSVVYVRDGLAAAETHSITVAGKGGRLELDGIVVLR